MPHDPFDKLPHGRLNELEKNPFAADSEGEAIVDESILTPAGAAVVAAPDTYTVLQPHRGQLAQLLGIMGLVLTVIAGVLLVWVPPLPVLALPFTIAAWKIGHHELLGMRRGLVDRQGEAAARRGQWFGLIGTVLAGLECVVAGAYEAYYMLFR